MEYNNYRGISLHPTSLQVSIKYIAEATHPLLGIHFWLYFCYKTNPGEAVEIHHTNSSALFLCLQSLWLCFARKMHEILSHQEITGKVIKLVQAWLNGSKRGVWLVIFIYDEFTIENGLKKVVSALHFNLVLDNVIKEVAKVKLNYIYAVKSQL